MGGQDRHLPPPPPSPRPVRDSCIILDIPRQDVLSTLHMALQPQGCRILAEVGGILPPFHLSDKGLCLGTQPSNTSWQRPCLL